VTEVYLSLGSNIGSSLSILKNALIDIQNINGVQNVHISKFYETAPISDIPQNNFINTACRLTTQLQASILLKELQKIEQKYGKMPKAKNAPRSLDIDIILFGTEQIQLPLLTVPHPHWKDRLFVLIPLKDLADKLHIPHTVSIDSLIAACPHQDNQIVKLIDQD
jgi:2-amino-4-hydroxy-6-hydroxymethyldihydropteridine diphosphokinase